MKNRFLAVLATLLLLCLAACASAPASDTPNGQMSEVTASAGMQLPDSVSGGGEYTGKSEYRIGSQDLLKISIFMNEELERELRVNSSGQISLPLIGVVQAGGKTVLELETEIAEKLSKSYLQNPQVTVFIKEFTSQRVTVEGAVKKAGIFPIMGRTTLLQAVALAGGTESDTADNESVVVFRTVDGKRMVAKFNLQQIRGGEATDPQIYGDDIVVVNESKAKVGFKRFLQSIPVLNTFVLY
jgi:polysaccharide biosynthesis/export protein